MDIAMKQAIDNCTESVTVCTEALEHCREMGGKHAEERHLKLLEDCAKICETSVDFMNRESDNHQLICSACAEICAQCAQSCEALAEDDEVMQRCAEVCYRSAQSCEAMAEVI